MAGARFTVTIYRLGMENGKVQSNPARLLRRKREDNGRVRYLNQFQPGKTEIDYLKDCNDEESRLRAVIPHPAAGNLLHQFVVTEIAKWRQDRNQPGRA
jgi:hypothetical protein